MNDSVSIHISGEVPLVQHYDGQTLFSNSPNGCILYLVDDMTGARTQLLETSTPVNINFAQTIQPGQHFEVFAKS